MLGCSSFPARKVLNSLLEQNKIKVIGNARATKYVLNNDTGYFEKKYRKIYYYGIAMNIYILIIKPSKLSRLYGISLEGLF